MLSFDEFHAYTQSKAFDVISSGHFKRHLGQCREAGELWAVTMYNQQNKVSAKIREISVLVGQLTTPRSQLVQRLCKDVMACAQPPIKVLTGANKCCITGIHAEHCIDLTRAGKNSVGVFVHPRFWHFFVLLWFCSKLEYVIRACTKQWLDSQDIQPDPGSFTTLCEDYAVQNLEFCERLFQLFEKGFEYTTRSLSIYRDKYAMQPILDENLSRENDTE
jgi:hypothetical protein